MTDNNLAEEKNFVYSNYLVIFTTTFPNSTFSTFDWIKLLEINSKWSFRDNNQGHNYWFSCKKAPNCSFPHVTITKYVRAIWSVASSVFSNHKQTADLASFLFTGETWEPFVCQHLGPIFFWQPCCRGWPLPHQCHRSAHHHITPASLTVNQVKTAFSGTEVGIIRQGASEAGQVHICYKEWKETRVLLLRLPPLWNLKFAQREMPFAFPQIILSLTCPTKP